MGCTVGKQGKQTNLNKYQRQKQQIKQQPNLNHQIAENTNQNLDNYKDSNEQKQIEPKINEIAKQNDNFINKNTDKKHNEIQNEQEKYFNNEQLLQFSPEKEQSKNQNKVQNVNLNGKEQEKEISSQKENENQNRIEIKELTQSQNSNSEKMIQQKQQSARINSNKANTFITPQNIEQKLQNQDINNNKLNSDQPIKVNPFKIPENLQSQKIQLQKSNQSKIQSQTQSKEIDSHVDIKQQILHQNYQSELSPSYPNNFNNGCNQNIGQTDSQQNLIAYYNIQKSNNNQLNSQQEDEQFENSLDTSGISENEGISNKNIIKVTQNQQKMSTISQLDFKQSLISKQQELFQKQTKSQNPHLNSLPNKQKPTQFLNNKLDFKQIYQQKLQYLNHIHPHEPKKTMKITEIPQMYKNPNRKKKWYCEISDKQYIYFMKTIEQEGNSSFQEWVKLLQKHSQSQNSVFESQQSQTNINSSVNIQIKDIQTPKLSQESCQFQNLPDSRNPVWNTQKAVLNQKTRLWFDDLIEKNSRKQQSIGAFDRKYIQIQEQFKWFLNSIANVVFNSHNYKTTGYNTIPGQSRSRRDYLRNNGSYTNNSSSKSFMQKQMDQKIEDFEQFANQQARQNNGQNLNVSHQSIQFDQPEIYEGLFSKELPDFSSVLWKHGFVFKGGLNQLFLEYNQNDYNLKYKDLFDIKQNLIQNQQDNKQIQNIPVTFIFPLIHAVESTSWVLYGTPIIYCGNTNILSISQLKNDLSAFGKDFHLLQQIQQNHLKQIYKNEEQSKRKNIYLTITNIYDIFYEKLHSQIGIQGMMVSQDYSANVIYLEKQFDEFIQIDHINKLLGYQELNIDDSQILFQDEQINNYNGFGKNTFIHSKYKYEIFLFKIFSQAFKMVYVTNKSQNTQHFGKINEKAMSLIASSSHNYKQLPQILGNVKIPYFEIERKLKNDKYYLKLANINVFKKDWEIYQSYFTNRSYFNVKEYAQLKLISQHSLNQIQSQQDIGTPIFQENLNIQLQPIFYKIQLEDHFDLNIPLLRNSLSRNPSNNYDSNIYGQISLLQSEYFLPDQESVSDFIIYIESIFTGLKSIDVQESYLIEIYAIHILYQFFIENDDEQCKILTEKIVANLNSNPINSPDLIIIIHSIIGLISEKKSLLEAEQNYVMALLTIHKIYGDPRGRGAIGVLENTIENVKDKLYPWMLTNIQNCANNYSNQFWLTSDLKNFQLNILQNSFTANLSQAPSSNSNFSLNKFERQASVSEQKQFQYQESLNTQKSFKFDKKQQFFKQQGSIVQIFERDLSTYSKKEIQGVVYSWGFNNAGQIGSILQKEKKQQNQIKIQFPKLILPLKDTIIVGIYCGYSFSIAITLSRQLLAWGDNSYKQLGIGDLPRNQNQDKILVPTLVKGIQNVATVTCGIEHTVALDFSGHVYTWGNGESGLLGHGDCNTQVVPKLVDSLKHLKIDSISCGSLHTVALSQGKCYTWGKGEGGQLGLPENLLINNNGDQFIYTPQLIQKGLEGVFIKQIACGDAHTLALTDQGRVHGWGYTNYGQLGLGYEYDTIENHPGKMLIIREPILLEKIKHIKIQQIFAGATFSMFMNEKKELYSCGLNDQNQLGQEKQQPIILNLNTPIKSQNTSGQKNRKIKNEMINRQDFTIPRKIDSFNDIPILHLTCGCNHSIALALAGDTKHYMLFSWGLNKHFQLGLGDIGVNNTPPRPITYLQDTITHSIGVGNYHSSVVLGQVKALGEPRQYMQNIVQKSSWQIKYLEQENYYKAQESAYNSNKNQFNPQLPSNSISQTQYKNNPKKDHFKIFQE
ncbi:Regulator of chromosome condensation 1/beta-lactamase-inhibitor protein II [Pseudocohnilembus persalinus]|uniref:Regulator of chromosome condensation 1/beta-lactamase-inhibitor protein II n=1 Tax=Pseudocohnilembus persalinus TaxID=266149 RepID=A0A0V0R1A6_PSEPJ|nr:Regulator of chromosome condensation 1/beta-lactamase-inhibitor protein II [Pseudocohnilembus persalinus]|eukprot:KRX08322.1 Regulator of chromosome condensation 1/beta-lactamase-inhibitor protein II [Pseudocohnilembus persalinus]